jgi:hypothetical protein
MNKKVNLLITELKIFLFKNKWSGLVWFLFLLSFLVGLYGSLKVVFGLFGIETDTCHSIMLWDGVNSFGMAWLKDWIFTQDNWLFSLVPFHFLGFLLFGAKPSLVVLAGWLIFVLSALVSGLVAWQLNAKRAAFLIPLTLLFSGLYAHSLGLVSYSTSHNITNLFGLASLLLMIKWAKKQQTSILFFILLLLVAGAISDPWMVAAYNLPIVLVSIFLLMTPLIKVDRIDCIKLLLTSAGSIFAVKSHFFGALNFLPDMHFQLGSWSTINSNLVFLIKDLGGLLNILPFHNSNDFIPAVLSIGIIAILIFKNINIAIKKNLHAQNGVFVFFLFSFFSLGGILLAFMLSSVEAANYSGRFLLNCLYLIAIGLGVLIDLNWEKLPNTQRVFSASVIILFLLSGIVSNFQLWKNHGLALKDNGTSSLIDFLRKNNLSYGYGPYWGANANAVTAISKSEIHIRPVVFNKTNGMMITGNRPESSRRWYTIEDLPADQKQYFVFVKSDGEECADIDLCIKGLSKQFGDPSRVLKYGDAFVLVWNHPLIGYEHSPKRIVLDKAIHFDEINDPPMWPGWSVPEKWGTWSDGDSSLMLLALSNTPQNDIELLINGHAFLADKHPSQEVDILVNGHHVATLKYDQQSNGGVRVVKIPKPLALEKNGQLLIKFNFKNPKSPAELGLSADTRRLGLGIVSLEIKTAKK